MDPLLPDDTVLMQQPAHLRYMDGLRAVAVLGVIFYHAIGEASWAWPWLEAPISAQPAWWFATFASKGSHGVDLFFVISGFCLSYPVLARLRREGTAPFDVRGFLARRMIRILPPFYVAFALFAAWMIATQVAGVVRPTGMGVEHSPLKLLGQLFFLDRGANFPNGSFWTLSIEFRWYLAFPLVLALYVYSQRAFFTLLAACVVAFNFTTFRAIDIATLPAFMLGIVAADWQLTGHRFRKYAPILGLIALDVALVLEPYSSQPSRWGLADEAGFFVQTNVGWQLFAFCLVVAAGTLPALRRFFELRALCAVGVAAYSIYLTHQPIIDIWSEHAGLRVAPVWSFSGAVALSLLAGFAFWLFGERPFVERPLRPLLISWLEPKVAAVLTFIGVPVRFALSSPVIPAVDAIREPEASVVPAPVVAAQGSVA